MHQLISIVFVLTSSVLCGQEIQHILNRAVEYEESGQLEQARYYYSIAKERDSTDEYKLNKKLFGIDSVLLFENASESIIYHIAKGDSAFFSSDNLNALTHYINSGESTQNYVRYRVDQIVHLEPEMKLKLLILLSKKTLANGTIDTLNIASYLRDSVYLNPSAEHWKQSDSTLYIDKFKKLITNKAWDQAQDLVIGQILLYGHKMLFDDHLAQLYKIRMTELDMNKNSLLLKLERIERIEQSDIPDEKEIKRILKGIDCNRINSEEIREKFEGFKKRYTD